MTDRDSENIDKTNYRAAINVRPLLIALTVVALVSGLMLILGRIWPDWPWILLFLFEIFIAVESTLTSLWLRKPNHFASSMKIRGAELVVIFFLLRLFTWLITSSFPGRSELYRILRHPESVFDGFFVLAVLVTLFVMLRTHSLTHLFSQLSLDRSELPGIKKSSRSSVLGNEYSPLLIDRHALLQRYYRDWAIGGAILIICAGITTYDLVEIINIDPGIRSISSFSRIGLRPEMFAALMIYFLGGLLLASEGRLAALNARWTYEGAKIENRIIRSWRRSSLLLLFIIALTAAFIPISSTVDISGVLRAISWIAFLIVGLIVALITAIYYFLLSGLMRFTPADSRPDVQLSEVVPDIPQLASPPNEITSLILGTIFWIILLVAIIIAIIYLIRTRGTPPKRSISEWWRNLIHWLRKQWRSLFYQVQLVTGSLRSKITAMDPPKLTAPSSWRFIRLGSLSARDRVRYYYLSSVKRAGARGAIRKDGETPSEYTRELKDKWPGVSDEIDELTRSFIKARYSGQLIDETDANYVKPIWKRVRSAIKRRVRSRPESDQ
jgi:hypothetical protein